jgi:DNA polymerase III delta prime subunit
VQDTDVLLANASKEGRKIEWLNDKLTGFCQTMPFGEFKVVILDEADYLNPQSVQPALRNLMEEYSHSVRFILTCNYPNRIIPALHSRCQQVHIEKTDLTEFTARVATILVEENVEFDLDTLDTYVKGTYPDLRKCINNVQMNSLDGRLHAPEANDSSTDYRVEMVELFKKGKIQEARKLLCSQARPEEMEDIYRWMYDNITMFGSTESLQDNAILIIKQGLVDHISVADAEINLSATLIRLARNMAQ